MLRRRVVLRRRVLPLRAHRLRAHRPVHGLARYLQRVLQREPHEHEREREEPPREDGDRKDRSRDERERDDLGANGGPEPAFRGAPQLVGVCGGESIRRNQPEAPDAPWIGRHRPRANERVRELSAAIGALADSIRLEPLELSSLSCHQAPLALPGVVFSARSLSREHDAHRAVALEHPRLRVAAQPLALER